MSAVDDILSALPAEQISQQVGASPDEVRSTAAAVLPALLGGLQANAGDASGAGSILQALHQHDDDLLSGGTDLSAIDEQDGRAIASHIFGDQQDEVANRLGGLPGVGGSGAGGDLVSKLLPILAPMVLSWLAGKVLKGGGGLGGGTASAQPADPAPSLPGGGGGSTPGSLEDMLKDVLGGAVSGGSAGSSAGAEASAGFDPGSIIGDVLGGILGGGRR
ncbi:MAG: DUF937 domain-containing protein [Ornithinibacter sp.]